MNIIKYTPDSDGVYSPIMQDWTLPVPDGWLQVAPNCDTSTMQTHAGFVTLTITGGVVTAIVGNDAEYQAWKAANPEQPAQPGPITQTQLALAELAETESAHDFENKLALAELAEMIGGTSNG